MRGAVPRFITSGTNFEQQGRRLIVYAADHSSR